MPPERAGADAARLAAEAAPGRIAFLHIPKTAGTSLTQALATHWGRVRIIGRWEELRDLPPSGLDDITLFAGHFFARQLTHPALAAFVPVTVLRDPIARLFSEYRFGRYTAEMGRPLTPSMEYGLRVDFFEYAFSGMGSWGRHMQLFMLGLEEGEQHSTVPLGDLLHRAKRRLDTMRVGLTEDLAPFLERLFAEARAPVPSLPRLMAQDTVEDDGLTAAQRAVLAEVLAPDYALYAHGRAVMQRWLDRDPAVAAG